MTTTSESTNRADPGAKRPRQHKNAKGGSNHHKTKGPNKKHSKPNKSSKSNGAGRGRAPAVAAPTTIVFDAVARAKYLQGFSQRKQERRAYGLAMQKVKDRRAKLERRAELKLAQQEQIREAEEMKQNMLQEQIQGTRMKTTAKRLDDDNGSEKNSGASVADLEEDGLDEIQTYQDEQTQQQWGGTVIVTTSTHIPGAEEEEEEEDDNHKDGIDDQRTRNMRAPTAGGHRKTVDAEQAYAGNVERFLKQLKGHLPSKRKSRDVKQRRGGQHGASQMKGVGSGADLKTAQKVLMRATKQAKGKDRGGGNKRKR